MRQFLGILVFVVGLIAASAEAVADRFQQVCSIVPVYAGPYRTEMRQVCRLVRVAETVGTWGYNSRIVSQPNRAQIISRLPQQYPYPGVVYRRR